MIQGAAASGSERSGLLASFLEAEAMKDKIALGVTRSALDIMKAEGEAAVKLIEAANVGNNVNTYA
ncbi:MAG: hypothetical protein BWZ10_00765 [candidate division BRC1 bacterium ADurb.BinA364]|nr:MAG: hypothetical protein BWZ10_00765 [candidate division BRC1 bacterium ADurb.BinA364]